MSNDEMGGNVALPAQAQATSDSNQHPSESPRSGIGFGHAIALYVGAVLGAGVLVLPGKAAEVAGPASLLAWAFVGVLGVPLAMTFATLATKIPDAGGVATFVTRAFSPRAGGVAGWWYFVAGSVGQTVVPLTGGYYVVSALGVDHRFAFVVAIAILAAAVASNLAGLRLSGRVQLAVAAGVGLLLLAATLAAIPRIDLANFAPFAPHGLSGIGQAALILFFAFAGWEAVAHLAAEFRDIRDVRRASMATVVIVLSLYLGVAFMVVATGTYGAPETTRVAVGRMLGDAFGLSATAVTAVAAVVISVATTNAFVASVSRLGYALGRDQWMPTWMGRTNDRGAPAAGIWAVAGIGVAGLAVSYVTGWGAEDIVLVPSTLVVFTYLAGTAAAARLLSGRARALAVTAFIATAVVVPFAARAIVIPLAVALLALLYRYISSRRRTTADSKA